MRIIANDPWRLRRLALGKKVMVDTFRGTIRIRKWPRKRGPSKNPKVREQNEWFKAVNRITRVAAPSQQRLAIEITKKSGLYPRDLLMRTISGGVFAVPTVTGTLIQPWHRSVVLAGFQGARLTRTTNQSIIAAGLTVLIWQTPEIDTAGMWDIASPSLLTVPLGINLIEFTSGQQIDSGNGQGDVRIEDTASVIYGLRTFAANINGWATMTTGPIIVVPGQQFRVKVNNLGNVRNLAAAPQTWFGCTISTIFGT